jgi:hypothetical protein
MESQAATGQTVVIVIQQVGTTQSHVLSCASSEAIIDAFDRGKESSTMKMNAAIDGQLSTTSASYLGSKEIKDKDNIDKPAKHMERVLV